MSPCSRVTTTGAASRSGSRSVGSAWRAQEVSVRNTERLWSALEDADALSGVRVAWADKLHEDLDVLMAFLRPRPGLVESYPCPYPGYGCPREVVCHGPDDMVAVCRSNEV